MRQVRFTFDDGPAFPGVTDDTYWNGFLNVSVTPETRAAIAACPDLGWDDATAELADFLALPVGGAGLVSLAYGYSTQEAEALATQGGVMIMQTKHTPGPWEYDPENEAGDPTAIWSGGFPVAHVESGEDMHDNARLLSAAPDLLAALEKAADLLGEMEPDPQLQAEMRAAIAKARGEVAP